MHENDNAIITDRIPFKVLIKVH